MPCWQPSQTLLYDVIFGSCGWCSQSRWHFFCRQHPMTTCTSRRPTYVPSGHVLAHLENIAKLGARARSFVSIATEISFAVIVAAENKRTARKRRKGAIRCVLGVCWYGRRDVVTSTNHGRASCARAWVRHSRARSVAGGDNRKEVMLLGILKKKHSPCALFMCSVQKR